MLAKRGWCSPLYCKTRKRAAATAELSGSNVLASFVWPKMRWETRTGGILESRAPLGGLTVVQATVTPATTLPVSFDHT